ncbi:MAG: hypothetical protein R6V50_07345 [Thermoplasmatota archaeon]
MKKKIIGILACFLMLAVIPTASGLLNTAQQEAEPISIVKERIILRGVILNPRTTLGGKFAFYGVRVHYTSIGIQGIRRGVINMQRITLPDSPNGIISNGYIFASIRGNIENII